MRVKITPYYDKQASPANPFWYKSKIEDEYFVTCGESWDEAKARHIQKLSDAMIAPTPPLEEEVEL
jgi:hypothetical protein